MIHVIRDNFCKLCIKSYVVTPHLNRSDEGSQHMVSVRNEKKHAQLSSNTPSYLKF